MEGCTTPLRSREDALKQREKLIDKDLEVDISSSKGMSAIHHKDISSPWFVNAGTNSDDGFFSPHESSPSSNPSPELLAVRTAAEAGQEI